MMKEGGSVLLVGVGGQGVVLASAIVAETALRAGWDVKQSEVHGMSQRGGVVSSHLRFGQRVYSPLVEIGQADAVVAMEWNEGLRAMPYLRRGAPLIINLQRVIPPGACRNRLSGESTYPALALEALADQVGDVRACDAGEIAREVGSAKALNAVLLGVLAPVMPFPEEAWLASLADHAPKGTSAANELAFLAGQALRYPDETHAQAARAALSPNGLHGQARPPRLEVIEAWCKGRACEICVRACPEWCLAIDGSAAVRVVRPEACTGCRLCELLCPDFAIEVHTA
ncbi:MAG: 2-oxoacid:acceptor oxidoreductase family protein [Deltaproteobacteria bacterium]|nr:2-oxoacid:acceptor oxidoreductase family protein [Deltaproteobacteria bacterium]